MTLVVTDTGPLLHLHEVGALELLQNLGTVYTTPVVLTEFQIHVPALKGNDLPVWLVLTEVSDAVTSRAMDWLNSQTLHHGEAEALAFASEIGADLFLTDDSAAREMGESIGMQVRGSLGVVLYSAVSGFIDFHQCRKILDDLEDGSTLWMSSKVKASVDEALLQIFGRA
jgi:predicted nucleic acid-binding protein